MRNCVCFVLLFLSVSLYAGNLKLWYDKPASEWTEALPLGNSRLGVMVYGGTEVEEPAIKRGNILGWSTAQK